MCAASSAQAAGFFLIVCIVNREVVSRHCLGAPHVGTIYFITSCAAGRRRRGTMSIAARSMSFMLMLMTQTVVAGENWPQFRGPAGNGHAEANRRADPLERDRACRVEDTHPWPRMVLARRVGPADLAHNRP